jgi:DNA-binding winged helix-turn-helix (wHTH) protein/Flp pilus assembly protein TadD
VSRERQIQALRFGVFEVNFSARELRKHGTRVRLPGQPFAILAMLLEKPGEVVTREEMRGRLWASDTFVDFEHSLNSAIKKLRSALSDSPEKSLYIETLPRIGYRFIAPVTIATANIETPPSTLPSSGIPLPATSRSESTQPVSTRVARGRRRLVLFVTAIGLSAALLAKYFYNRSETSLPRDKDTVLLADFENTTGEQVFDEALRQGLAVGLEQSPHLQILSDRKSAVILKQMGRPPDERLTGRMAIELCQRAGSKLMVQGSISSLGTTYLIGLTAIRCDNSDAVAHEQAEARYREEIIRALGEAATRLRTRLGESISSIHKYNAPLEQVSTASLEALKAYGTAVSMHSKEGDRAAIPFYNRAVQLDPNFALAYGQLATIYQNQGETQLARENSVKAFQHKERLTESERLVIEAWYNIIVTGDLEKATQFYEEEVQNYPPSANVLNDLGANYGNLGRYDKAAEILRHALRVDPDGATTYANLAAGLLATNKIDEARAILAEADNRKFQTDFLLQVHYWEAFLQGNSKEMERILSQAATVPGAGPLLLSEQARTEAYFGRLEKSRQFSELAARMMEREDDKESAAACQAELAVREAEIGNGRRARGHALNALQQARSQTVVTLAALVMAQNGDFKRAQLLVDELNKGHPTDTLIQKYWIPTIRARMELRQGTWSKALETLSVAAPFDFATSPALPISTLYPAYVRGEIYLAAGDGRRAVAEYNKLIDHPGMVLNFPLGALAHLGLARAYSLQEDRVKAHDAYQDFFALWKDADPDVPILKQAKAEYANLP